MLRLQRSPTHGRVSHDGNLILLRFSLKTAPIRHPRDFTSKSLQHAHPYGDKRVVAIPCTDCAVGKPQSKEVRFLANLLAEARPGSRPLTMLHARFIALLFYLCRLFSQTDASTLDATMKQCRIPSSEYRACLARTVPWISRLETSPPQSRVVSAIPRIKESSLIISFLGMPANEYLDRVKIVYDHRVRRRKMVVSYGEVHIKLALRGT